MFNVPTQFFLRPQHIVQGGGGPSRLCRQCCRGKRRREEENYHCVAGHRHRLDHTRALVRRASKVGATLLWEHWHMWRKPQQARTPSRPGSSEGKPRTYTRTTIHENVGGIQHTTPSCLYYVCCLTSVISGEILARQRPRTPLTRVYTQNARSRAMVPVADARNTRRAKGDVTYHRR